MATKFLEPGGDADFGLALWSSSQFTPATATDFVHGTHVKSIKYRPNFGDELDVTGVLADAGGRISWWVYFNALPAALTTIAATTTASLGATVIRVRLTSGGVVQLFNNSTGQLGSNGATLATGQWYRLTLTWVITSTSVNTIKLFVNGVSSISVTNGSLTNNSSNSFKIGNIGADSAVDMRTSDHYIDDSNANTDPGNIWVTAKRPVSNGTAVEFTTQIGSGGSGYGSGHTPQVNERALSTTNGWSISTTTKKTEEYTIEAASVGDIDLTGATIVDYVGWMNASVGSTANSPVHHIIVGSVATAKTLTTSTAIYTQAAGSSTYPAGNTDIGIDAQFTTTPHLTSLFECGVLVAYTPSVTTTKTQPATARITASTTKTQPATARIQVTTARTQSALARIQKAVAQTQAALARITGTTARTQPATARIKATSTRTTTATARLQKAVSQTITALARLTGAATKNQPATARVTAVTLRTQSALARIQATSTKTQPATARLRIVTTKTQPALARISASILRTLTATARITVTVLRTITATARLTAATTRTQPALARIRAIATATITATAAIAVVGFADMHQPATARIRLVVLHLQTATARLHATTIRTVPATARLRATILRLQTCAARLTSTVNAFQPATARITITSTRDMHATAHLSATTLRTQSALARIGAGNVNRTITCTARIVLPFPLHPREVDSTLLITPSLVSGTAVLPAKREVSDTVVVEAGEVS